MLSLQLPQFNVRKPARRGPPAVIGKAQAILHRRRQPMRQGLDLVHAVFGDVGVGLDGRDRPVGGKRRTIDDGAGNVRGRRRDDVQGLDGVAVTGGVLPAMDGVRGRRVQLGCNPLACRVPIQLHALLLEVLKRPRLVQHQHQHQHQLLPMPAPPSPRPCSVPREVAQGTSVVEARPWWWS